MIERPSEPRQELASSTIRGKTELLHASLPKTSQAKTHETQNWQAWLAQTNRPRYFNKVLLNEHEFRRHYRVYLRNQTKAHETITVNEKQSHWMRITRRVSISFIELFSKEDCFTLRIQVQKKLASCNWKSQKGYQKEKEKEVHRALMSRQRRRSDRNARNQIFWKQ